MKSIILLISFVGLHSCSAYKDGMESWVKRLPQDDELAYIDRPCSVDDLDCVKRFFADHSQCKVALGLVADPFEVKQVVATLAVADMTFTMNNLKVRGLNGKITSFYVNKKTKNLVIAIEIVNTTFTSSDTTIRYHRKGKEPIDLTDSFSIGFASITFTATIPNYNKLQLSNAEIFTHVDDSNPIFAAGPNLMKSLDPVVISSFNKLTTGLSAGTTEAFVTVGRLYMFTIIQNMICDFGLILT